MGAKLLFVYLPYISVAVFLVGVVYRIGRWMKAPVPLRIVTTPAPQTYGGVAWRLLGDVLWFPSLFKADRLLWLGGFSLHILLWLVLLRHLRYFLYPVPEWVTTLQSLGLYAGYFIAIPLAFLLIRRLLIERVLYLSILEDYFALLLLLSICISGVLLGVFFRTYVIDVKALVLGLIHLKPILPDVHWLFALHFLLVMVLLIYFPFGKLMHSGGLLLSPTRNQRANFAKRFINPWDFPVEYNRENLFPPEKYRAALGQSQEGSNT